MAGVGTRARMTKRPAFALAIVGAVGLTLLASACGGSSDAKVAQIGTTTGPKRFGLRERLALG
jgi:hypothetical protein